MDDQRTLVSYLAEDRVRAMSCGESLAPRSQGSALFADISGFTAFTEGLRARLGPRRGAEELSLILDATYAALIAEVEAESGSVICFAGDSITCWFDAGIAAGTSGRRSAAGQALRCAFALQEAMATTIMTKDAGEALRIKVSVASGEASRIVAGDPVRQLHDTIGGLTITRMVMGEQLAESGQVIIDSSTGELVGEAFHRVGKRKDPTSAESFSLVEAGARQGPRRSAPQRGAGAITLDPDSLRPWISDSVFRRQTTGQGALINVFRPCVALFVNFTGIDLDAPEGGPRLDGLVRRIEEVASRRGGELLQVVVGDKGSYAYLAFGAVTAHEDDARRAVDAALEIREFGAGEGLSSHPRTGISSGTLFVGSYGGPTRRAFSALGAEANIAARLMQKAGPGEILVSARMVRALEGAFRVEEGHSLQLKGTLDSFDVFLVSGARRERSVRLLEPVLGLPMSGRTAERQAIREALDAAHGGCLRVVAMEGEAGLGKSRLLAELVKEARGRGFACLGGASQAGSRRCLRASTLSWRAAVPR
ncbi:MAG: adenylate/guanylate cyclase domain-containing protein [Rectinemataceae bacterium]